MKSTPKLSAYFQSVSINFDFQIGGVDSKTNISLLPTGIQSTESINWEDNGIAHTVKSNSGIGILGFSGFGMEWGQGSNGIMGGSGFRVNLNPFDTMDFYNFSSQSNGMITNRREAGVYINSGILELGVVLLVAFGPEILAALSTAAPVLAEFAMVLVVLCLINNEINKDPCELGES